MTNYDVQQVTTTQAVEIFGQVFSEADFIHMGISVKYSDKLCEISNDDSPHMSWTSCKPVEFVMIEVDDKPVIQATFESGFRQFIPVDDGIKSIGIYEFDLDQNGVCEYLIMESSAEIWNPSFIKFQSAYVLCDPESMDEIIPDENVEDSSTDSQKKLAHLNHLGFLNRAFGHFSIKGRR